MRSTRGDIVEDLLCTLQYRALSGSHLVIDARGSHNCNCSKEALQALATVGWMVVGILKGTCSILSCGHILSNRPPPQQVLEN